MSHAGRSGVTGDPHLVGKMRLVYGVLGYGRGHATRALGILPRLSQKHDIRVLAGGSAHDALAPEWRVDRIPTLSYVYGDRGKISTWRTLCENAGRIRDLMLGGPTLDAVIATMREVRPDVVISDAEPYTHLAARRLGIPRIGFDHFGILAHCRPPLAGLDRARVLRDVWAYRMLTGNPQRVIISSFYTAPPRRAGVRCIPTLLRDELFAFRPRRGEHILVYFNSGQRQLTPATYEVLRGLRRTVLIYGTSFVGADENIVFRPADNRAFLEDLASAAALVSTAGNQLVGEAIYYGKPMLVTPESTVEQRVNAAAVERLGIGLRARGADLRADEIDRVLRECPEMAGAARRLSADGRDQALAALEADIAELAPVRARAPKMLWRTA